VVCLPSRVETIDRSITDKQRFCMSFAVSELWKAIISPRKVLALFSTIAGSTCLSAGWLSHFQDTRAEGMDAFSIASRGRRKLAILWIHLHEQ
jgi:hypothetical protein